MSSVIVHQIVVIVQERMKPISIVHELNKEGKSIIHPLYIRRLFCSTGFTDAKDLEDVPFDLEAILSSYAFLEFFDQALIQMHTRSARFAHEVVMVFTWLNELVASLSVAQIDGLHQPQGNKRFK